MSRWPALLSCVALAACEGPVRVASPDASARVPPATTTSPSPAASTFAIAAPSASTARPLPELPPALELGGKRACTFETRSFLAQSESGSLKLRKDGPAFARVVGGDVTMTIPNGPTDVALLAAQSEGVVVSGLVAAADIQLEPATAFVMGGFVVPNPGTALTITSAEDDSITVKLLLPNMVVAAKEAIEETRPCSNVGFDRGKFDTMAPVFGTRSGDGKTISGGPAPITLKPNGPTVATLMIPAEGELVFAFAEQSGRTLIAWHTERVLAFGWVRSSRLTPTKGGRGSSLEGGSGRNRPRTQTPIAYVQCAAEVPLIGQVAGEQKTVGRILSGTTIGVAAWGEQLSRVVVRTASIFEWGAGTFAARTAELRACREVSAPVPP